MNRYQTLIRTGLILYWLLLFTVTHIPLKKGTLPQGTDVPIHFIAYAGLSFLLTWWLSLKWDKLTLKRLIAVFVGVSLFGMLDEFLQGIPILQREPSLDDWVADTLGGLLGIAFYLLVHKPLRRLMQNFQNADKQP
ncbi:VanZ family protein [Gimesia fumaroli]|uniref:VanZ like family protein n=1 Tax=Gimesia fumaroli TaxID=2527976 RepID=A0A518IJB4_9PLAN|nr:VanZ family protein [Gimesia fumaroli]QDV53165.1 VanZ like family protein [Gimesia fumaroli]